MKSSELFIVFGGPSHEKGISLNSARSLHDHLENIKTINISLIFVTESLQFYLIEKIWLYCNTTDDFKFKLQSIDSMDIHQFLKLSKQRKALIWPVIHGLYGEDGQLQSTLEEERIPFVGSGSKACEKVFKKTSALQFLKDFELSDNSYQLFSQVPSLEKIELFIQKNKKCVCKPNTGGSSLGVFTFKTAEEFFEKYETEQKYYNNNILIERFHEGTEFSIVILEHNNKIYPLIPCSIHYDQNLFFDFRKKYLPSNDSSVSCPAKFPESLITIIQNYAQKIFKTLGAKDLLRIDGWVLDDEKIIFSDFNLSSGLEQNSLLFLQAATAKISHLALCKHVLSNHNIDCTNTEQQEQQNKKNIFILVGGSSAEKQVSLMSGTNVWLKLKNNPTYNVRIFFVKSNGLINEIYEDIALYHTCEEIESKLNNLKNTVCDLTTMMPHSIPDKMQDLQLTKNYEISQEEFCIKGQKENAYVFLALHGGDGEDGTWQHRLQEYDLDFNGSNSATSRLCMDKNKTGLCINKIKNAQLYSLEKYSFNINNIDDYQVESFFNKYNKIVIKPLADGCSSGVCVLCNAEQFTTYVNLIKRGKVKVPPNTFTDQTQSIELPSTKLFILEPFIQTNQSEWIEMTYGVLEDTGVINILSGSQCLTEESILTVEEKFQGGTGTNLTPCPLLTEEDAQHLKYLLKIAVKALGIENYARIDIFYHLKKKEVIVIEANTLPALTPSTVFYHQGLVEGFDPKQILAKIINNSINETSKKLAS